MPKGQLRRLVFDVECDKGLPGRRLAGDVPIEFIELVHGVVQEKYGELFGTTATAQMQITARKPGKRIHLHFPRIVDYPENMVNIHGQVVKALQTRWHAESSEPFEGNWGEIIDGSIYKNVGLRTLLASKPRYTKSELKPHEPTHERFYLPYDKDMRLMKAREITVEEFRNASLIPSKEQLDDLKEAIAQLFTVRTHRDNKVMKNVVVPSKRKLGASVDYISGHINTPIHQLALNAGGPLLFEHIVPLLLALGFKDLKQRTARDQGFSFDADRTCNCVVCNKRIHTSNDWLVTRVAEHCFSVRNFSTQCNNKLIGFEQSTALRSILQHPRVDADYAQLFVSAVRGCLFWTGSERSKRFVHYSGHRWRTTTIEEVMQCLLQMLTGVMERLTRAINDMLHAVRSDASLTAKEKQLNNAENELNYKKAFAGIEHVKSGRNLRTILGLVKTQLINSAFEKSLDVNGYLLGVDNGVIDLAGGDSGVPFFRAGEPDDMMSRSTGYDYIAPGSELWDESINTRVREFISRIYPVEDERELVQRWAGYCLLGVHREKFFTVFTDMRDGYCGKSKFCALLMAAMGPEYSKDGGSNALLYENQNNLTTVNSHASGMLAFKGVRVCVFEELMRNRKLDNAILKKYNGGKVSFEGREAKAVGDSSFEWSCKMILNANEGSIPAFDWSDGALLDRLLVINHRSKFYADPAEYELHKHEENTFPAEDVDHLIGGEWRPYALQWALEGLARYNDIRLTKLPASCKGFKANLVAQQDTVTPWINDHLTQTDDLDDQVVPAEAYERFNLTEPGQRNKSTRIPSTLFNKRLVEHMGPMPDRRTRKGVRLTQRWFKWRLV